MEETAILHAIAASAGATQALATLAREFSVSLNRYADALDKGAGRTIEQPIMAVFGPTTSELPWKERELRQSLILHEIQERGGSVPSGTWKQIAARYGYQGRGLAGFFRGNGAGMLEQHANGKVYITKHGRDRLRQNIDRVKVALVELAEREELVSTG